jgi:HEPN domain-containing protein
MADSTDYRKWVERAKGFKDPGSRLYRRLGWNGGFFLLICHQAAEKLLKAFLIRYMKATSQTHDLVFLLGKCQKRLHRFYLFGDEKFISMRQEE